MIGRVRDSSARPAKAIRTGKYFLFRKKIARDSLPHMRDGATPQLILNNIQITPAVGIPDGTVITPTKGWFSTFI